MEQRVVWELGRWQQSREPVSPRISAEPRPSLRPAVSAPSAPVSAAPRIAAAAAPAYDYAPSVEAAPRPEPPQLVRTLPEEPVPPPQSKPTASDRPAALPQRRRPAPLSVAETPAEPETPAEGRRARKARERAESKQRAEAQKAGEAAARAEAKAREAAEREEVRDRAKADRVEKRRAAAEEPSRTDRRRARKHSRLTDGIVLHDGETITLTMSGWSRGRAAVLVVTRYRVALITRLPHSVHWIPLEEVSKTSLRWRLGWTLEIEGSVEFLSFHKRTREKLVAAKELLASEVTEARAPGGRRHHPEVTQDWCDRSIEVWETHAGQIRLFIRRHPLLVVATLVVWVPVAYYFALR